MNNDTKFAIWLLLGGLLTVSVGYALMSRPDKESAYFDTVDSNDWIIFDDSTIGTAALTLSRESYIDLVIDLNGIHIEIDYDPNENIFVCTGAYDANVARQAIQEVLATEGLHVEYTLRILVIALCSAYGLYDEGVISDMLTASFVFEEFESGP